MAKVSMHIGRNKVSRTHNNRTYDEDRWNRDGHINRDKSRDNVVLIDRPLYEVFQEQFGEAIEQFNEKQSKHPDRKTTVHKYYLEHKKEQVEMVFQFGNEMDRPLTDEQYVKLFRDCVEKFQKDNPNLVVFGAYIHLDETTPHLHLDYLPVADSNRGMSKKASMEGALGCMGYKRSKEQKFDSTPWKCWERDLRNNFEQFVEQSTGVKVDEHDKSSCSHKELWAYKQNKQQIKELTRELSHLCHELDGYRAVIDNILSNALSDLSKDRYKALLDDTQKQIEKLLVDYETHTNTLEGLGYDR